MKHHGSRDNRGRTSPLVASAGGPQGGPTPEEKTAQRRQTAVTVIRRLGHVANVAVAELVRMASSEGDEELAEWLGEVAGQLVQELVHISFIESDVSDFPEEA